MAMRETGLRKGSTTNLMDCDPHLDCKNVSYFCLVMSSVLATKKMFYPMSDAVNLRYFKIRLVNPNKLIV